MLTDEQIDIMKAARAKKVSILRLLCSKFEKAQRPAKNEFLQKVEPMGGAKKRFYQG